MIWAHMLNCRLIVARVEPQVHPVAGLPGNRGTSPKDGTAPFKGTPQSAIYQMVDNNADQLMLKVLSTLNEAQARWFVAREAICRGRGGLSRMHELTGLSRVTILRGMRELSQQQLLGATDPIRQTRGDGKRLEEATPAKTTQRPQHESPAIRQAAVPNTPAWRGTEI